MIACLVTLAPAAAAQFDEIVIVSGGDNRYYAETASTLSRHVGGSARLRVVAAQKLVQEIDGDNSRRLFVALGGTAVDTVRTLDTGAALISAYQTLEQYRQRPKDNQFAVLLEQPLARYVAFCKLVLNLESVGIISIDSIAPDAHTRRALDELGMTLNQYRVDPNNKLLPVLRNLLDSNDALLMLPRQALYNRESLKGVLLTSYRARKPAISYSPAHVKSGALASIFSSPVDIGRHLALVVNRRLADPSANTEGFEFARFYSISSNRRVADALALTLPEESSLRLRLDRIAL